LRVSKFAHRTIAVGGTFDILHVGHEHLLGRAFELGETVFIGVTGDKLVPKLHKTHVVRALPARKRGLRKFLQSRRWLRRARIIELKDPLGPAAERRDLEALVVSEDTRSNGIRANALRRRRGLPPLRLYTVRLVKSRDGKPVSVTRIRLGKIESRGRLSGARLRDERGEMNISHDA